MLDNRSVHRVWGVVLLAGLAGCDLLLGLDTITTSGMLWCTGGNSFGQLGLGSFDDQHEMAQVGSDSDWVSVTAGYQHTCATKADQSLWCWGRNDRGQLGDGTAWTSLPMRVP